MAGRSARTAYLISERTQHRDRPGQARPGLRTTGAHRHALRPLRGRRPPAGLLPGRRHGQLPYVAGAGHRALEADLPVPDDTLWRIYSMTKPITSVAAM